MSDIEKYPDNLWMWSVISRNPNIFEHITKGCYEQYKHCKQLPLVKRYEEANFKPIKSAAFRV